MINMAQPISMTDEQFQALGGLYEQSQAQTREQLQVLGALYERTQVENRQIARLSQAAQSMDRWTCG